MTGKMATDGTRELITVVETISGDGMAPSPLIITRVWRIIWGGISTWIP